MTVRLIAFKMEDAMGRDFDQKFTDIFAVDGNAASLEALAFRLATKM